MNLSKIPDGQNKQYERSLLNGFALLYVYRDLNNDFEQVIDKFSRKNWALNLK